jgi:hypothetical protein
MTRLRRGGTIEAMVNGSHNDRRRRRWRTRRAAAGLVLASTIAVNLGAQMAEVLVHRAHREPPTIGSLQSNGMPPHVAEYFLRPEPSAQAVAMLSGSNTARAYAQPAMGVGEAPGVSVRIGT